MRRVLPLALLASGCAAVIGFEAAEFGAREPTDGGADRGALLPEDTGVPPDDGAVVQPDDASEASLPCESPLDASALCRESFSQGIFGSAAVENSRRGSIDVVKDAGAPYLSASVAPEDAGDDGSLSFARATWSGSLDGGVTQFVLDFDIRADPSCDGAAFMELVTPIAGSGDTAVVRVLRTGAKDYVGEYISHPDAAIFPDLTIPVSGAGVTNGWTHARIEVDRVRGALDLYLGCELAGKVQIQTGATLSWKLQAGVVGTFQLGACDVAVRNIVLRAP